MEVKHSPALLRIRQACSLGLPSRQVMPLVLRELRSVVPAACAQFTWSSPDGRLANFWCDTFMPRRTAWIVLHRARYEADAGTTFRELVLFGRATGNLRRWWTSGFEHSATYKAAFEPYGFKWFLDGVVRDGARPLGTVALIRKRDDPDFSAAEEALLARVLPYIAHAVRADGRAPARFIRTGRSAMLVCSTDGELLEWSDEAHRLAAYALLDEINVDARVGDGDFERVQQGLRELVAELVAQLDDEHDEAAPPMVMRRNGWGEFTFRGYRLRPAAALQAGAASSVGAAAAAAGGGRIGLLVEQAVPWEARLLDSINRLDLSPRQKEIALLSARGLPNAEITRQLRLSAHTLKDHFKAIYLRLGVNSQRELVEIVSREPGGDPPPRGDEGKRPTA